MMRELINVITENIADIVNIRISGHSRKIHIRFNKGTILSKGDENNCVTAYFTRHSVKCYFYGCLYNKPRDWIKFDINYDEFIDADEFIGLILCRIFYNDK